MQMLQVTALLLLGSLSLPAPGASIVLAPDGSTPTYALIESVLGARTIEVPDCAHPSFGPHITQAFDSTLGQYTFLFHLHVTPDNDRCLLTDRQRNEIKVTDTSAEALKIRSGDTVFYRWRFRLDAGFQNSPDFSHHHQVRAYDGDDTQPLITLTSRSKTDEVLELAYVDSLGSRRLLTTLPFGQLRGEWIEASSRMTAGSHGQYALTLTRLRDKAVLLNYSNPDLDLWRSGTTFLRPKWGLYRSLANPAFLRDEQARIASICMAKGSNDCQPALRFNIPDSAVTASANAGSADNTVDGRLWTRWSADGDGQWIQYDLGSSRVVTEVDIAWYKGRSARFRFDILVSTDGVNFTQAFSGLSSGTTTRREPYPLGAVNARWVRIVGQGNTVNDLIAITETDIMGLP